MLLVSAHSQKILWTDVTDGVVIATAECKNRIQTMRQSRSTALVAVSFTNGSVIEFYSPN